ncbi:GMC oxidoreductase-like protein 12 [Elsinoe fawcettii]|nr:GMC oxidoreductase-like protein 12 [Elsinoe fawcettii]
MYKILVYLSLFSLALGSPRQEQQFKRQSIFTGLFSGFLGFFGVTQTYDYVIIGGGTAGLTLANRLSANSKITVAVVEAGTYYQAANPLLSSTPAGDVLFVGSDPADNNPLVDWSFVTAPQSGANGRRIRYARGKCLGGSSARNFMIYQRPDRGSMQQWADQVGDSSFTWDAMQPYFRKSAKLTPPNTTKRAANATTKFRAEAFDSAGTPLSVSYANYAGPFSSWIEKGFSAIGMPVAEDFNSGELNGHQYCSSTINPDKQQRDSSQTSFLQATTGRSNLKVYTGTTAKKIIFDSSKKATGIDVTTVGFSNYRLNARREIILSAGAFQSPQLLMVSGIGPASTLRQFNIPIIADRPGVGQNLTDHIFFGPSYRTVVETFTRLSNDLLYVGAQFAVPYTINKSGPLTNPVCDYLGWEKTPRSLLSPAAASALSSLPPSWPEIEYLSAPGYVGNFANLLTTQPKDGFQYATILAALVAPLSRGTVTLASASAADLPVIDPRWLTDPTDAAVAVAAYKRVRQAFASEGMRPGLADPKEYFPGEKVQSDEQILGTIRDTLHTVWHASCTCRMGRREDPNAVVDGKTNVIGVTGLKVVDASSFALLPPGHPQSVVYALAEKVADEILKGI